MDPRPVLCSMVATSHVQLFKFNMKCSSSVTGHTPRPNSHRWVVPPNCTAQIQSISIAAESSLGQCGSRILMVSRLKI